MLHQATSGAPETGAKLPEPIGDTGGLVRHRLHDHVDGIPVLVHPTDDVSLRNTPLERFPIEHLEWQFSSRQNWCLPACATCSPAVIATVSMLIVLASYYVVYARFHLRLSPEELISIDAKVSLVWWA